MNRSSSSTTRRRLTSSNPKKGFRFKIIIFILIIIFLITSVILVLKNLTPTKVECITNEHTYCTEDISNEFKDLKNVAWWQWLNTFEGTKKEVQNKYSQVVRVTWQPTLLGGVEIKVTAAEKLFSFQDNQENLIMLSNGEVISSLQVSYPVLTFKDSSLWKNLNERQRENVGLLYQKLKSLSPPVKLITINELNNVVVNLENQTQFLMRADLEKDILTQVNTLQAFLRSSTMKEDYQTVDLRFADQVIVRE